ncbi:type VI secretion system-associated protein [Halorhodospira abdelmalekii]|uniref:type VI secretion system baseplate subunit TssK n=1 Tax=Halorhodospira abdelmalekii TaxID=421629 RepID=UPI001904A096|nr:type VI secretion system baseplate subunit TssK [Halorhodospira abdelmalekii]MBK1735819.1 type VI secretion system-associated protein [Halorhodospira abdelmalekii]
MAGAASFEWAQQRPRSEVVKMVRSERWRRLERPVWAEGVLVAPQHLQLWERYQERSQQVRAAAGMVDGYGVIDLQIDEMALASGALRLLSCRLLFADGRLLGFDERLDGPLEIAVGDLPAEGVIVYLAMPSNERVAAVPGYDAAATAAGWRARFAEVGDEIDEERRREVMLASPNLRLSLGELPEGGWSALAIAHLEPVSETACRQSATFVPSCCRLAASPVLCGLLERHFTRTLGRLELLRRQQAAAGRLDDFAPTQIARLLLLQVLAPVVAELQALQGNLQAHPWLLYNALLRLAAGLSSFITDAGEGEESGAEADAGFGGDAGGALAPSLLPPVWPVYDHARLGEVMAQLDTLLLRLLDEAMPQGLGRIRLHAESAAVRLVEGIEARTFTEQALYLAVRCDQAESLAWIEALPRQLKIGARSELERIVAAALPGVQLRYVQRPPSRLPVKSGYEYFHLQPFGEYWERAQAAASLALFVPTALQRARIEMIAIEGEG